MAYIEGIKNVFVKYPVYTRGTFCFGKDDYGEDVYFYGATSGTYVHWDESADTLYFVGTPIFSYGVSGTELVLTEGSPMFALYSTCASTDGSTSAEPFVVENTMTGAAGVGGRARFQLTVSAALGGWSNALKAYTTYGASGKTAGMGSALCAELSLSAGTSDGTYAPLEGELVLGSGASTGTSTAFMYLNASGAGVATFDSNGYLFIIGTGITPAAGKFISANSHTAKVLIESNTRYLFLSQIENGLGIGASGSAVSFSQGSPLMAMYATCSSAHASNSVVPWYFESTMTGAGGVGGRAHFYMTTNVALGGWSNAIKGEVVYGASGRTNGLGSAILAELQLSAGTTQGNYAPLEIELGCGSGASTGTKTALMYLGVYGTDVGTLDDNAYLFTLAGVTGGDGHLFDDAMSEDTSPAINATLKVNIDGTDWWIPLSDTKDCS